MMEVIDRDDTLGSGFDVDAGYQPDHRESFLGPDDGDAEVDIDDVLPDDCSDISMAGGGDVPLDPTDTGLPSPDDDPEFQGACFGTDILDELIGEVRIPAEELGHQGYDERERIVHEAKLTVKAMRDNMLRVARELGMEVSPEQITTWRPSAAEMAALRRNLEPLRRLAGMINGAITYIDDQAMAAAEEGIRLRPHQQDVVKGYREFLVHGEPTTPQGGKSGLILQPTGTGKTRELVEIVAMVKHAEDPENPTRVLVLAPTDVIQGQTVGADGKRGFGKFLPNVEVGRYDQHTPKGDKEDVLAKEVVTMCLPSFLSLVRQGNMPWFDKVVVDEAHLFTGPIVSRELLNYCADKILVGLTAADTAAETEEVSKLRQVFQHLIAEMELPEAVQRGLLAPVRGWLIRADPVIDRSKLPRDAQERRAAIREARLEARVQAAIEIIKEELERGYREVEGGIGVVVRCGPGDDIEAAYQFAKRLRGLFVKGPNGPLDLRQIMPAFIGGSTRRQKRGQRVDVLEAYEDKRVNVVTNVKALQEGWDSEFPKVWIDLTRGTAVTVKEGMGRTLRLMHGRNGEIIKGPDGKPIEAHVYSFVGSGQPGKSYTVLDALGTDSGELLGHDDNPEAPIPVPRTFGGRSQGGDMVKPEVDVTDIVTTTVGTTALEHAEVEILPEEPSRQSPINSIAPSGWPNQSGLPEFIEVFGAELEVPPQEAARILGVSSLTLRGLLRNFWGDTNHLITLQDVGDLLEMFPDLQAPPVPETGFAELTPRDRALKSFARSQGIVPRKFTKTDGTISFFLASDDIQRLLSIVQNT